MEYKYIGTIVSTRGFCGEMRVTDLQFGLISIEENTKVRIGYSLQFSREMTLKKWRQTNKSAKLELVEIKTEDSALDLLESGIFIEENNIQHKNNQSISTNQLIDYKVIDNETNNEVGYVEDYLELPANDVILVNIEDKSIPIPMVDEYIIKIDDRNKKIKINFINGITSLNF